MEEIIPYLQSFYTKEAIEKIVKELKVYYEKLPKVPLQLFSKNWYKDSNLYLVYPDSIKTDHEVPLKSLRSHLTHVKELGCNAVHILPFLASPMRDKGYDVSDYYKIREGLGKKEDLKELKNEADRLGIHLFMDLIFNHVSIDHEWFVKAQKGDVYYRDFFIHSQETPQYLGKVEKEDGLYAQYMVNGEKTLVSLAFPEGPGQLPHWTQGKDGFWYYHTFYSHQIDVNWKNPEVFIAYAKILLYWTSFGFHFRFDAIPFIGKAAYKHLNTHNPFTHHLTEVLNVLAKQVNPNCIFILEVNEELRSDIEYFGTSNIHQARMLYNFQLSAYLWATLIDKNADHLWKQLKKDREIPAHAQWINFLRNHDELSLAVLPKVLQAKVYKKLLPNGKPFSEGFDLGGRTYSLLGGDEKHFLMSYFLLSSLPGGLLIPYGDDYGMENIKISELSLDERADARNINRGKLTNKIIKSKKGQHIFYQMSQILIMRQLLRNYLNIWPVKIIDEKGIFGAKYSLGTSELVIFINLTKHTKSINFELGSFVEITSLNLINVFSNKIKLGPYSGAWLQK
ncbi:MAG TPA: alpha-amylase family glycosyl hydrolase [Patescibacteria group bacterium]